MQRPSDLKRSCSSLDEYRQPCIRAAIIAINLREFLTGVRFQAITSAIVLICIDRGTNFHELRHSFLFNLTSDKEERECRMPR